MFKNLWKYAKQLLCISIVSTSMLSAQDCAQVAHLESGYDELVEKVNAIKPLEAIFLADSLSLLIQEKGAEDCPLFFWIQYEKGDALELLLDRSNEALNLYYDIIKKAEAKGYWEIAAQIYISIGRVHEAIGRPEDCLRNLEIAREVIEKHQFQAIYSRFAVRYSSYHRIYDSKDTARVYAVQAIDFGRRYKVKRSELDGNLLMGMLSGDLEESVFYFQEATKIYLKRQAYFGAASQQMNIARKYHENGDIEQAVAYLDTAFVYTKQIVETYAGYHHTFERYYDYKRKIFESQSMIDSAYIYLNKSQEAGQLNSIRINQQGINQKETAFAIEREQDKLRLEQQRSRFLVISLVFVGFILLILLLAFVNNKKEKRFILKQKDLIAIKNEALNESLHRQSILLSEIHHRVKNSLQLVISLLSIRVHKTGDKKVRDHFEGISNKIYSISLIHEQLYQSEEFELVDLNAYFTKLITHFQALDNVKHSFEFTIEIDSIFLNLDTIIPLGIICAELINNSLKYGHQPDQELAIRLTIKKEEDKYRFYYQDNGLGYLGGKLESKPNSMGYMLISSMVRQLKGESKVYNAEGAVFELIFLEKMVSIIK